MKITVIGTGYVGLVSGACLAQLGHDVVCVDSDAAKIDSILAGVMPIYEPHLDALVADNLAQQRLTVTTDAARAIVDADVVMIAVGTPPREEDGHADLRYVLAAAQQIAQAMRGYTLVVTKSTVPIGTGAQIEAVLAQHKTDATAQFSVASNPEFLREGTAIDDFMHPERIVIGATSERAKAMLAELYMPLTNQGVPLVSVGRETSEMIKYASNSFLATKVAFINEMADICEAVGADVEDVAYGMGLDTRIGAKFLKAGPGFGGSCFPKDAQALMHIAIQKDVPAPITSAVVHANLARKSRMTQKIIVACGGSVVGITIAVLGLTFKPNTDDMRESPSLVILPELVAAGARIHAYDPEGMKEAKALLPQEGVVFVDSARAALADASAGVILTEWKEFSTLQAEDFIALLQRPLVIDLRNIYQPQRMRDAGVEYHCIGRAAV